MSSPDAFVTASPAASSPDLPHLQFRFDNTYARLPERFYARQAPTPVNAPRLVRLNVDLALSLGLNPEALASVEGVEILAGNRVADGSEPLALAYAGHQFGYFVPQLGDGRANLLGEVLSRDGQRFDIQLKGSGPTAFSRRGDGRAALGSVLREYLVSEAMAALGVPTTRALAAVTTGQRVLRDTALPGAVFTRVARSHIRVGTFQYFAARGDNEAIRTLADYAIARHDPEAARASKPGLAFLDGVITRQAHLVAQWMLLGFVHGIMNTDNMSISGETIDYGPCAFLEDYDPDAVFSSIDHQGRYAYGSQPEAALWNLTRLAEALLPLLEQEEGSKDAALASARHVLSSFTPRFEAARDIGMRRKIGLFTEHEGDASLALDLLDRMAANHADFTLTFRRLSQINTDVSNASTRSSTNKLDSTGEPDSPSDRVRALFADPGAFDSWATQWHQRLEHEPLSRHARSTAMRLVNPAFIPRNHQVEASLTAAVDRQDFQPFEDLLAVLSRPFDDQPGLEHYTLPARPEERVSQTFCGT